MKKTGRTRKKENAEVGGVVGGVGGTGSVCTFASRTWRAVVG